MFCCQMDDFENREGVNFSDSPLKVKLLEKIGLRPFLINQFVFPRPRPKYNIEKSNGKFYLFIREQRYIPPFGFDESIHILTSNSVSIPLVMLSPKEKAAKSVIVFSHGNGCDLAQSVSFITSVAEMHFDNHETALVGYDYSGYGQSSLKETTTESICEDLETIIAWLDRPLKEIILIGFSLGCYPTAKMASKYKVKGVILVAPLMSIVSLLAEQSKLTVNSFFKNDQLNTFQVIQNIESHLMLIHSIDDELIPFRHSQLIYQRYRNLSKNKSVKLLKVDKLKHNQMLTQIQYVRYGLQKQFIQFLRDTISGEPVSVMIQRKHKINMQRKKELHDGYIKQKSEEQKKKIQIRKQKIVKQNLEKIRLSLPSSQ